MAKWIYMIGSNCDDPSKEEAYNEWYTNVHVHDLVGRVPDAIRATRYELVKSFPPAKDIPGLPKFMPAPNPDNVPKFLAIYEAESGDIEQGLERFFATSRKVGEEGRHNPLAVIVYRIAYRRILGPLDKKSVQN